MPVVNIGGNIASLKTLHDPNVQQLHRILQETREWLLRAGRDTARRFFLSLIQRVHDPKALNRLVILLSSASQKDFVYTRSRSNPGLPSDLSTISNNRALSSKTTEESIRHVWSWYSETNEHCRICFVLYVARLCADTGISHQACNLCKTLLAQLAYSPFTRRDEIDNNELADTASLDSSSYSFHTDDHPELYQFVAVNPHYGPVILPPLDEDIMLSTKEKANARGDILTETMSVKSDNSIDPRTCIVPTSHSALSGISPCRDFISDLPVHLSKAILGTLSRRDLSSCALSCKRWHHLVTQVRSDEFALQIIKEEAILMQGISAKGSNPTYANFRKMLVPVIDDATHDVILLHPVIESSLPFTLADSDRIFESAFQGLETRFVEVEERNVYCGAYNLLVLDQRFNSNRVISYAGETNMLVGSVDKIVRMMDISSGRERKPCMQGHPGSITALHMATVKQGSVYSGSYDTTIRKWNMNTGSCQLILHGHRKSITCLHLCGDILVSGAYDGLVKAWNTITGACVCTFKHTRKSVVTCVQIHNGIIASTCERGLVKIWNLKTRRLVKCLNNHGGRKVNCVRFGENLLLSGGNDDYLLLWSMPGRKSICLKAYRHPNAVLCIELKYMCAITGCADGKIRVINMLSGECLRVLRGNSQCDPIITLCATENRLVVNTSSNCLVMHFESVEWEYNISSKKESSAHIAGDKKSRRPISSTILHSVSRANRINLTSATDKRIRTSSAPPMPSSGKRSQTYMIHSAPVVRRQSRPPSNYIDLQPEFRRPKSGRSMISVDPERTENKQFCFERIRPASVSASCISGASLCTSVSRNSRLQAPSFASSLNVRGVRYKYSDIKRDNILMRVGMIKNCEKDAPHNRNTELNAVNYFDRFRIPVAPQLSHKESKKAGICLNVPSKLSVGRYTTDKEQIKEIKSVFKDPVQDVSKGRSLSSTRLFFTQLDPLRSNCNLIPSTGKSDSKESENNSMKVDNFLSHQLGI